MFNPPNPRAFFEIVWDIARQIPPGTVSTYGQIASMIPPGDDMEPRQMRSLAPRWVGTALRKSPRGAGIPWQRVINRQGAVSFPAGSPQAAEQRRRLESEGVRFDSRGRVDFTVVGWQGPDELYLRHKNLLPPRPLT